MLFSVLIYGSEAIEEALPDEVLQERIKEHQAFQAPLREQGKLGGAIRLMPTTSAVTLRAGNLEDTVTDGPFAETKEQLLGFYLIDCESLEAAIKAARQLPKAAGPIEIRPVAYYDGSNLKDDQPVVRGGD